MANSQAYNDSQIQVLEGLEAVRKRPGMYIGTTSQRGLHHLLYEIVDNSIDEALAGRCDRVQVMLLPDNSVSVEDNGNGVPGGMNEKLGLPNLEVVFTVLHAGGKFGGSGYKFSGGLHGVGASVVNALSEWMEVVNCNRGELSTERFERGFVARPIEHKGRTEHSGLYVRYMADSTVFETLHADYQTILNRLREQAFLNAGVHIELYDLRGSEDAELLKAAETPFIDFQPIFDARRGMAVASSDDVLEKEDQTGKVYDHSNDEDADSDESKLEYVGAVAEERRVEHVSLCYEGGVVSFVEHINRAKHGEVLHPDVMYFAVQSDGGASGRACTAEVAMQYNDSYNETLITFANNIKTIEGGTHETGFKAALTRVFNSYGKKYGFLKDDDKNLSGEDVREGLCAIVSVKLQEAQFEGQTKGKLGNSEIRPLVENLVADKLMEYLEERPAVAKLIFEKAQTAARARENARRAREQTRRKNVLESSMLPGVLTDCTDKNSENTELYLVEGRSAGGSAKDKREPKYQAILPMRGKSLNVEKSRPDKIYANQQLIPIIQAIGGGVGADFDLSKVRYGKIIIMADADVDGMHIRTLLLTFFYRYMQPLVDKGHVFLANPPLFKVFKGKQEKYAFSDAERDKYLEEMGNNAKAERYKGLGEMDAEQLWDTTMNPEKRTLYRVTLEDAYAADEIFSILMGQRVEPRKLFIERNAKYAVNVDV